MGTAITILPIPLNCTPPLCIRGKENIILLPCTITLTSENVDMLINIENTLALLDNEELGHYSDLWNTYWNIVERIQSSIKNTNVFVFNERYRCQLICVMYALKDYENDIPDYFEKVVDMPTLKAFYAFIDKLR